ncbi:MAG: DUF502 domain-containing protein [Bdellovibrionota bacterium]
MKALNTYIARIFWRGLLTLLPVTLTIYIVYWILSHVESGARFIFEGFIPEISRTPGLGLLSVLILIALTGIFMGSSFARSIVSFLDGRLRSVPLVKTIYGSLKDFSDYFDDDLGKGLGNVALIKMQGSNTRIMGFLTNEAPVDHLGENFEGHVCVYLPMSYQVGGYMIIVPEEDVEVLDIKSDSAFKFVMTGGLTSPEASDKIIDSNSKLLTKSKV